MQVVEELETVLQFNDLLTHLSKHPEAGRFPPGVGPVSLFGVHNIPASWFHCFTDSVLLYTFSHGCS